MEKIACRINGKFQAYFIFIGSVENPVEILGMEQKKVGSNE